MGRSHPAISEQGKVATGGTRKAEPLFVRSLVMRDKVLGPDHPDTILGVRDLIRVHAAQGQDKEAEALRDRLPTLELRAVHPDPGAGLTEMTIPPRNIRVYVAPKALTTGGQVRSAQVEHTAEGGQVKVAFTEEGARRLRA
jgi:hypothetical protein